MNDHAPELTTKPICAKCGADVIVRYAGSTQVWRHAVVPPRDDAHYPVLTARSTPEASPPGSSLTATSNSGPQASPGLPEPSFPEKSPPAA